MSKTDDDARITGSHIADRATSGGLDMDVRNNSIEDGPHHAGVCADGDGGVPRRSRRAAEVPVDAVPAAGQERESLVRARDREALRAFRALAEVQAVSDVGWVRVETPTRRQLRLQQVDGRAVAPGPKADPPLDGAVRTPLPGGRRDRRRRQTDDQAAPESTASEPAASEPATPAPTTSQPAASRAPAVTADETATPSSNARRIEDMSVEETLAARQSIAQDAREHLAGLQAAGAGDPLAVDLEVLAQQKALADRAAVLNSRARRMQELSEQNQQRASPLNDPAAAHNLSIVTPPEFVQVPGSTQSVLRAPTTSHIPIVLPRLRQLASVPFQVQGSGSGRADGPAPTITEPIGARDAFGLDPLDAMTAGLGRLRRVRYLQYSLLVVGATALMTGIIMTVSSLNG